MIRENIWVLITMTVIAISGFAFLVERNQDRLRIEMSDRSINDLSLVMTRSACEGSCPVYEIAVSADGAIRFEGFAHTEIVGVAEGTLTDAQLSAVADAIIRADFFGIDAASLCDNKVFDLPHLNIWIRWRENERELERGDCLNRYPDRIEVLGSEIDSIVGTDRWISNDRRMNSD